MHIFITGGAGFIGSNLVGELLHEGECKRIVVFDNLKSGSITYLEKHFSDPRLEFIRGDLHEAERLVRAMVGIDQLIHLAANPDISQAEKNPVLDFNEGTMLTQIVMEAARINKIRNVIFTSGSGVYGESQNSVFSEEYGPCLPISPYGAAKLASEALISAYCHMFQMQGVSLRFANVVGPNQTHGVGYDFIKKLLIDNRKLVILGDGEQSKSYIYISDVLEAIKLAVAGKLSSRPFDVFNVATNDYISVNEIARLACTTSGLEEESVAFLRTGGDRGWNGDVPKIRFDTKKIRAHGWRNKLTSKEAIERSLLDNYILLKTSTVPLYSADANSDFGEY